MPTEGEHIQKASHDEDFFNSFNLSSTPFLDWVITGIFYTALHYVDSYLATINVHPGEHFTRDSWFGRSPDLDPIHIYYRALKDESNLARYEIHQFNQRDIQNCLSDLMRIKNHLRSFVSSIPIS